MREILSILIILWASLIPFRFPAVLLYAGQAADFGVGVFPEQVGGFVFGGIFVLLWQDYRSDFYGNQGLVFHKEFSESFAFPKGNCHWYNRIPVAQCHFKSTFFKRAHRLVIIPPGSFRENMKPFFLFCKAVESFVKMPYSSQGLWYGNSSSSPD